MPDTVLVSGNRIDWPRQCVSCCTTKRLRRRPLRLAAMDGSVTADERKEVDPAYATVSWEYRICRHCLDDGSGGRVQWRYVDLAAIALPAISAVAALVHIVDWMLPLALVLIGILYAIPRVISALVVRRRIRNRAIQLPGGTFLRCKMIYDRYGREILGFDTFLELMRRGDVVCEFEFASPSYAEEFRRKNQLFEKAPYSRQK